MPGHALAIEIVTTSRHWLGGLPRTAPPGLSPCWAWLLGPRMLSLFCLPPQPLLWSYSRHVMQPSRHRISLRSRTRAISFPFQTSRRQLSVRRPMHISWWYTL